MKFLKKSVRKTEFLVLCLTSILIFVSLSIGYVEKLYQVMLEANNFKTKNHVSYFFNGNNMNYRDIIKSLKEMELEKNIVITHEGGRFFYPDSSQRGIYFNGIYKMGYNILEGRFFKKDDFKNNKKVAVVGKNLLDNLKIEKGKRYIYNGEEKFLVVGIMGKENIDTQYDSCILYNLNVVFDEKNVEYLKSGWTLDSMLRNKEDLKNVINKENKNFGSNFINIIYENPNCNPLISAIQNSQFLLLNFLFVIICIVLSLIKATVYWIDKITLELGVRKIYGASNRNIVKHIIQRYSIISGISLAISVIFQKILLQLNIFQIQNNRLNIFNIIASLVFILIIGNIVVFISVININKVETSQLIKGKV